MADNTPAPSAISVQPKKEFTAEDVFEPHILAKTDPEVVKIVLGGVNRGVPPTHAVPIEERRAHPDKYKVPWARDSTGWPRVSGQELTSEDGAKFPIKIYHPDPDVFGEGPYGVHLNFHEVTWGKAIEDAWAALKWAGESAKSLNINPDSISVGGISAGGHISLVLQHIARDANVPLKLCLATVPGTTKALFYKYYIDSPHPSFHEFFRGPILPWKSLEYFGEYCFPRDKLEERLALIPDWWADPLLKAKNWSGLCETYIRTAETDPLRDEGEAYALKLVTAGNKVTMKRYLGCPHVFMFWKGLKQKQEWDQDSVRALKVAHGTV
ncbi:alpha beta hydrolase fold protein [Seiridium cupressi]